MEREDKIKSLGYKIVSITSCEWNKHPKSKEWYHKIKSPICNYVDIKNAIMNDESFGIVKCSLHVPEHLIEKFSEFPPIFKNTEITIADN